MSQRIFEQGKYEVLTGWDRPLQYFFLTIQDKSLLSNDQRVFDNLGRRNPVTGQLLPAGMTLAEIAAELADLEIDYPPSLFIDLDQDRRTADDPHVGSNHVYHYKKDGRAVCVR